MDSEEEIREEKKDSMENIQVSSKNPGGHNNNSTSLESNEGKKRIVLPPINTRADLSNTQINEDELNDRNKLNKGDTQDTRRVADVKRINVGSKIILQAEESLEKNEGESEGEDSIVLSGNGSEESESSKSESSGIFGSYEDKVEDPNESTICKQRIRKFLRSPYYSVIITLLSLYALFFFYIRILAFQKKHDPAIFAFTFFIIFCFIIEILLLFYSHPKYPLSFPFWLNIFATISLLADVGWIIGEDESEVRMWVYSVCIVSRAGCLSLRVKKIVLNIKRYRIRKLYKKAIISQERISKKLSLMDKRKSLELEVVENKKDYNRAKSFAFKTKTNTLRKAIHRNSILTQRNMLSSSPNLNPHSFGKHEDQDKVTRSKFSSSYRKENEIRGDTPNLNEMSEVKEVEESIEQEERGRNQRIALSNLTEDLKEDDKKLKEIEEMEYRLPEQSAVGKLLFLYIRRRITFILFIWLLLVPLFSEFTWVTPYTSYECGLQMLYKLRTTANSEDYGQCYNKYLSDHSDIERNPIIYLKVPEQPVYESEEVDDLRFFEYKEFFVDSDNYVVIVDMRYDVKLSAGLEMCLVLCICLVVSLGAFAYEWDANDLVLTPILRMIETIKAIAHNPLLSINQWEHQGLFSILNRYHKKYEQSAKEKEREASYETNFLDNTIVRIGKLLSLVYGEAGSKIIAENLENKEIDEGDFNPLVTGNHMFGIFGFAYIKNFQSVLKVLQQEAPVLVNEIAEILHRSVHKYNGSVNRNLGDAFLLVWKFPDASLHYDQQKFDNNLGMGISVDKKDSEIVLNADLALFAFIKVIGQINKMQHILKYRKDKRIQREIPDYRVSMGFGLHMGYAIEGAIGSFYKIDTTYLSPNVNIAARLEMLTKHYNVDLLLSGNVQELLSPIPKSYTREIDTVTVKGSLEPIKIFTVDLDTEWLTPKLKEKSPKTQEVKMGERRKKDWRLVKSLMEGRKSTEQIFKTYEDLVHMIKHINPKFKGQFAAGFEKYISGEWKEADQLLKEALKLRPKDGPTMKILKYIQSNNFDSSQWKGYLALTQK